LTTLPGVDLGHDERGGRWAFGVGRGQRSRAPGRRPHDRERVPYLVRNRRRELSQGRELLALCDARARRVERVAGGPLAPSPLDGVAEEIAEERERAPDQTATSA